MKTPREILLARHEHAETSLARLTDDITAQLRGQAQAQRHAGWLDWLWPTPLAWGGLAATWLLILALNGGTFDLFNPPTLARAERTPETEQALREQRRLLTEMVGVPVEDTARPGPRSSVSSPFENA